LKLSQGGQAGPLGLETNVEKLGGWHHEDISYIGRTDAEITSEEGIALLLGEIGTGGT
jgi:hypothetical protein